MTINSECGIYKLTSPSGKFYVGSSCNIKRRLQQHGSKARLGKHGNSKLQAAFNKYGTLKADILLVCRVEDLIFYEQLCIDTFAPPYNQSPIAGPKISLGKTFTPEHRANMSAALRGRPCSPETRAKMRVAHKGKVLSPEHREKISAAKKGKRLPPFSPIHCARLSAAKIGHVLSAESRSKLAASQTGKKASLETRAKMRASARGRKMSPEAIAKRQASRYGSVS